MTKNVKVALVVVALVVLINVGTFLYARRALAADAASSSSSSAPLPRDGGPTR